MIEHLSDGKDIEYWVGVATHRSCQACHRTFMHHEIVTKTADWDICFDHEDCKKRIAEQS